MKDCIQKEHFCRSRAKKMSDVEGSLAGNDILSKTFDEDAVDSVKPIVVVPKKNYTLVSIKYKNTIHLIVTLKIICLFT